MRYIKSINNDPYFNLAAEEYLLKHTDLDVFMLWKSEPSVIVGKHQNTFDEIDYWYAKKKNIKIARRLSGGGAVYHDMGNINFTFILTKESGKQVNFKEVTIPVVNFLKQFSLNTHYGEKNDICINNKKISGNAEHIFRNRVLHHGTLLFSSEIASLKRSLKHIEGKFSGNGVQSKRSEVVNISGCLKNKIGISDFEDELIRFISGSKLDFYEFSFEQIKNIEDLKREKYITNDWIFGYSPDYKLNSSFTNKSGTHFTVLDVVKGKIAKCTIHSQTVDPVRIRKLEQNMQGILHNENDIRDRLESVLTADEKKILNLEEFIYSLF